jgi:hypothetical protein
MPDPKPHIFKQFSRADNVDNVRQFSMHKARVWLPALLRYKKKSIT